MNKLIGILCFFHALTLCLHATEEPKKQEKKATPNAIIWGLKNPIAPIPPRRQINKHETIDKPLEHDLKAKNHSSNLLFPPTTQTGILMICKANDTKAFITAFKDYFPPYDTRYSITDDNGNTPLHIACKKDNPDIVELLIENIHDLNTQNNKQQTPLHIACKKNSEKIVKLLCTKDIAFGQLDKKGSTPFHIVCMHNYATLAALLLVQFKRFPADRLSYITALNKFFLMPIHLACINNCVETVEVLLKDPFVDPNSVQDDGSWTTPLHFAVQMRFYEIIKLLLNHGQINPSAQNRREYIEWKKEEITKYNAKLNTSTKIEFDKPEYTYLPDNTPLHIACSNNDPVAVTLLLRHRRIIPKRKNADDKTPYDIACDNESTEIMALLEKYR